MISVSQHFRNRIWSDKSDLIADRQIEHFVVVGGALAAVVVVLAIVVVNVFLLVVVLLLPLFLIVVVYFDFMRGTQLSSSWNKELPDMI